MSRQRDDFPAQHIIPGGRGNAIGVRFWREFYRDILGTIEQAISAQGAADDASLNAQSAQTAADAAQVSADTLQTVLIDHITDIATTTRRGHVRRAQSPISSATTTAGAAPLAYSQAYVDALSVRLDDAHNRIDDLIIKLKSAGISD